jgi:hypothetical protein
MESELLKGRAAAGAAFSNIRDRAAAKAVNKMEGSIVILIREPDLESVLGRFAFKLVNEE